MLNRFIDLTPQAAGLVNSVWTTVQNLARQNKSLKFTAMLTVRSEIILEWCLEITTENQPAEMVSAMSLAQRDFCSRNTHGIHLSYSGHMCE